MPHGEPRCPGQTPGLTQLSDPQMARRQDRKQAITYSIMRNNKYHFHATESWKCLLCNNRQLRSFLFKLGFIK